MLFAHFAIYTAVYNCALSESEAALQPQLMRWFFVNTFEAFITRRAKGAFASKSTCHYDVCGSAERPQWSGMRCDGNMLIGMDFVNDTPG